MMAIQAKKSGLMIAGKIIEETDNLWVFKAMDEKMEKVIYKPDEKNKVFDGENAAEDAMAWIESVRGGK